MLQRVEPIRALRRARLARRKESGRGQSLVEMTLILPLLILLLAFVLEGGLAINVWLRVQTAARDGTRFALDGGRPAEVRTLVLDKLDGLTQDDIDIYIIKGHSNGNGVILSENWNVTRLYGSNTASPSVTRATIQERLGGAGSNAAKNVPFTIVEVHYIYRPLIMQLVTRSATLHMTSYAIVHQYSTL